MFFNRKESIEKIIQKGNLNKLKKQYSPDALTNADENGRFPLYYAIYYKNAEIARYLLDNGVSVQSGAENDQQYVMEFVLTQCNAPLLQVFLDFGEKLPKTVNQLPILHAVVEQEQLNEEYLEYILKITGGDINVVDLSYTQMSVLAYYISCEHLNVDPAMIRKMVALGADVNLASSAGVSPLYCALCNSKLSDLPQADKTTFDDVIDALNTQALDIHLKLPSISLAVRLLQHRRYAGFVKLLELGLEINEEDKEQIGQYIKAQNFGRTLTERLIAIDSKRQLHLPINSLLPTDNETSVKIAQLDGASEDAQAMFWDIFKADNLVVDEKIDLLSQLLAKGVDINAPKKVAGMTLSPLQYLCGWYENVQHNEAVFNFLIKNGAALECHGRSAWHMAIWLHNLELAKKLSECGCDLYFQGEHHTPVFTWVFTINPRGQFYSIDETVEVISLIIDCYKLRQLSVPWDEPFWFSFNSPHDLTRRASCLSGVVISHNAGGFTQLALGLIKLGWNIHQLISDSAFDDEPDKKEHPVSTWLRTYAKPGDDISELIEAIADGLDINNPQIGDPLRWAIVQGADIKTIRTLIKLSNKDNINRKRIVTVDGKTVETYHYGVIYAAIDLLNEPHHKELCFEVCRLLIEAGCDLNDPVDIHLQPACRDDGRGWGQYRNEESLLEWAVDSNNFEVFKLALENGADPRAKMGLTKEEFVHYAVSRCDRLEQGDVIRYLDEIDKLGLLDVNAETTINATPLLSAASKCRDEIVSYLLEHGANPDVCGGFDNSSSLHRAISNWNWIDKEQRRATVEALIKGGADVELIDPDGDTALMSAARYGALTAVDVLLEHGADACFGNSDGFTPLHMAAVGEYGYDTYIQRHCQENSVDQMLKIEIIQRLLDHGADINAATNERGYTAIMLAMFVDHDEIFDKLCSLGADLNQPDASGRTLLMLALSGADNAFINKLCARKHVRENIEHVDEEGRNLMHYIAMRGNDKEACKQYQLFTSRLNLSYRLSHSSTTPLHYAAFAGNSELINLMCQNGADVNQRDADGNTPLHVALFFDPDVTDLSEVEMVVTTLLTNGANPHQENSEGETPLKLASARGVTQSVELMSKMPVSTTLN